MPLEWNQLFTQLSWQAAWQHLPERKQLRPRLLRLHWGRIDILAHQEQCIEPVKPADHRGKSLEVEWSLRIKAYCGPTPLTGTSNFGNPIKKAKMQTASPEQRCDLNAFSYSLCTVLWGWALTPLWTLNNCNNFLMCCRGDQAPFLLGVGALSISQRTSFKKKTTTVERTKDSLFVFLLYLW